MPKLPFLLLTLCLVIARPGAAAEPLRVMVSIPPQAFFLERIGGDLIEPAVMVLPGSSPATYEPKPKQMSQLARSRLYMAIGVPFERAWLPRFASANPELRIVRTDRDVDKIPMDHGHGIVSGSREPHRSGFSPDPHIWLSPQRVVPLVRAMATALQTADPENKEHYAARLASFLAEVRELHIRLQELFRGRAGEPFLVNHPSWGYLAADYNLKQVPIEFQGKPPTPSRLKEIIGWARQQGIGTILVQPQFSRRQARTVAAAIGGSLVPADPLARDWKANLQRVAEIIAADLE